MKTYSSFINENLKASDWKRLLDETSSFQKRMYSVIGDDMRGANESNETREAFMELNTLISNWLIANAPKIKKMS